MKKLSVLLFAVVLAASGCGGSNQAKSGSVESTNGTVKASATEAQLVSSVTKTSDSKSSKIEMTVTSTGAQSFSLKADGSFDFDKKQGSQTAVVTSAAASGQSLTFEQVMDGTTIYQKLPAALAGSAAKPWIKIDVSTVTQNLGVNLNDLASGQSGDPTSNLSMLLAAGDDAQQVGKEDLRGTATTHYKVNLDFDQAAQKETNADRKAALTKLAGVYSNQPVPADVWLDGDGRVRKLAYTVDPAKVAVASTTTQVATGPIAFVIEFYDFGTPVSITVPPADQVTDASSLVGASKGSVGGTSAS